MENQSPPLFDLTQFSGPAEPPLQWPEPLSTTVADWDKPRPMTVTKSKRKPRKI
jgi:hypothetical protein